MGNLATIGLSEMYKTVQLSDGSLINCYIKDTAGQERFRSLNKLYYNDVDAVLLVYDITNKTSFESLRDYYIPKLKENCDEDVIVILLGNKTDLEEKRKVTYDEGINLALEEKYVFKESSCLKNKNVSGAFESLIEKWNFNNKKERGVKGEKEEKEEKVRSKRSNTFVKLTKSKDFGSFEDIKSRDRLKSLVQSTNINLKDKPTPSKRKCC